jgi:hypothetical protein
MLTPPTTRNASQQDLASTAVATGGHTDTKGAHADVQ